MKPRSIALGLALCVSLVSPPLVSPSYAQMPKSREKRLMALGKQLHVTRKQAKRLLPILNAEEPQLQAIRNDPSLSKAEKLHRMWAVHDQSTPQIKAILTPAQFQQLQAHRQQRREQLMAAVKTQLQSQGSASRLKWNRAEAKHHHHHHDYDSYYYPYSYGHNFGGGGFHRRGFHDGGGFHGCGGGYRGGGHR